MIRMATMGRLETSDLESLNLHTSKLLTSKRQTSKTRILRKHDRVGLNERFTVTISVVVTQHCLCPTGGKQSYGCLENDDLENEDLRPRKRRPRKRRPRKRRPGKRRPGKRRPRKRGNE